VRPSAPASGFGGFGGHRTQGPQSGPSTGARNGSGRTHGGAGVGGGARRSTSGAVFKYQGHSYARFVGPRYEWPHGFAYQRFEVGQRIAHVFWRPVHFLDDYADYGLADPPYGFEWVRYGPDVLLIDLNTGIVGQVIYGVFDDGPPPDGE
jgi:Ni/Co efflux regulator RcnB